MRLFLVTAACAAAFALPVLADQTPPASGGGSPTSAPASTTAKADEGVICKMKEVTGTRFTKKVCTTKAQRDEQAALGREVLDAKPRADKLPGS